jgi:predicted GH43/DUF377 family glycosyl hydrolase
MNGWLSIALSSLLIKIATPVQADEVVVDQFQVVIPGFPDAFNPSIVHWKGERLLSFRIEHQATSYTGLIWLDRDFRPTGEPQILWEVPSEDGRLFTKEDQLFLCFNDRLNHLRRVFVVELQWRSGAFVAASRQKLTFNAKRTEKNWSPFIWNGEICFIYTSSPFQLIRMAPNGLCSLIPSYASPTRWIWGELRGGTQAIPISAHEYITFFHSSISSEQCVRYFMGAMKFSSDPLFSITGISREPIIGKEFYTSDDKPRQIIYPAGVVMEGDFFYLSYGKDDREVWIAKLDRQKLFDQLK